MKKPRPTDIQHEAEIVWLENINQLDYVREYLSTHERFRRRRPRWERNGRLVGYSRLRTDAPNNGYPQSFTRRLFWLAPHDRDSAPDDVYGQGGLPCEGVDPRTVAPGVPGEKTLRACGESSKPKNHLHSNPHSRGQKSGCM